MVAALAIVALVPSVAGGSGAASAVAPAGQADWPMFHHDEARAGVSSETILTATNAAGLGVDWQANLGAASYVSPAVVWNATLGKTLVFAANQSGTVSAFAAATGDRLWVFKLTVHIQSSPAVADGVVYFGANDHFLYALDATTGTLRCRFQASGVISSSPLVTDDGSGTVV